MGVGSIDRAVELEREIARLQALQVRELAAYSASLDSASDVVSEIALALSIYENSARIKMTLARDLVTRLPETLAAMSRGEIDAYKTSKVAGPTSVLSDALAREVDSVVAGRLVGRDPSSIRRMVNRTVQKLDPQGCGCPRREAATGAACRADAHR